MNFVSNTLKTIMSGLAMQHAADHLSNTEKHTCMKEAVELKQQGSEPVAATQVDKSIDIDSVVLSQG